MSAQSFKALWANNSNSDPNAFKQMQCELRDTTIDELSSGSLLIRAEYSAINYKDALAVTGTGKILRQLPLIPGIDVSGTVISCSQGLFKEGDKVLINGANLGEKYCGGFSQVLRVPSDIALALPPGLSSREAMIYGTAGFTAALAVHQLELNGLRPEKGEVLVTGASGGVGSLALAFLNQLGYETEAWTRRESLTDWLHLCGASRVTDISGFDFKHAPMESVKWAGAIDNLGGKALSHILSQVDLWGSVATIGLVLSAQLDTTVFPMILRGVNLLGVSSNNCPQVLRQELWEKMASSLKPKNLDHIITEEIALQDIPTWAGKVLQSEHYGRVIVNHNL